MKTTLASILLALCAAISHADYIRQATETYPGGGGGGTPNAVTTNEYGVVEAPLGLTGAYVNNNWFFWFLGGSSVWLYQPNDLHIGGDDYSDGTPLPDYIDERAASQITNAVTSGYLCTVAAAEAKIQNATNGLLRAIDYHGDYITDGINTIYANGIVTNIVKLSSWTPLYSAHNENPQEGDEAWGRPFWYLTMSGPKWYCAYYRYEGGTWEPLGGQSEMQGDSENENADELKFPNGVTTRRSEIRVTRLATTNDIPNSYTKDETDTKISDATNPILSEVSTHSGQISVLNNGYTRLYNFSTGATNANFTSTNYPPTAAEAATRCHYQPEPGMDFTTVPASLQLNEFRDGSWRTVMDTRDWTVWYYRFKEIQLTNEIARLKAQNSSISNELENVKAWANHTANGVENPMTDTLVVDRPNMWLMADYEWQKCVSGSNQCFVIRAKNVALSGGANTNGFLEICDAFGKPYMRINKSAETFADPVFESITYDDDDGAWYIVYGNSTKPTKGGANCEIVGSSSGGGRCILYDEDDPDCPATITWPESAESHSGHWIMKAVPKPVGGVVPSKMFFGAEIKVAGKDYVEYIKEASFGAGIRVGNNVYEAVESGDTLIWQKKVD